MRIWIVSLPKKPTAIAQEQWHSAILLAMLLLGLAGYRFSLISTGHFYWADERCYLPAAQSVDAIGHGEWRKAARQLFVAPGKVPPARPGFVLVSVIPVLAQRWVGHLWGIEPGTPAYFHAACVFNVLVSLGVTWCVYGLGRLWTGRSSYGLLIAAVYSLLANANMWIRHLVPYQESLLFLLAGLWILSRNSAVPGRRFGANVMAGLLTGLGYACYPGHYGGVVINVLVAAWATSRTGNAETPKRQNAETSKLQSEPRAQATGRRPRAGAWGSDVESAIRDSQRPLPDPPKADGTEHIHSPFAIRHSPFFVASWLRGFVAFFRGFVAFAFGVSFVVVGFEFIARRSGRSYFSDLVTLSGSVSMGDPKEGFVFLWRYLRDVEGPVGIMLFCLFLVTPATMAVRVFQRVKPVAFVAIAAATAGYLLHASLGVWGGKIVFYGRVLMIYLPFLVGGAVLAIAQLPHAKIRRVGVAMLCTASLFSFGRFAAAYARVEYPAEFLQRTMDHLNRPVPYPANTLWGNFDGQSEGSADALDPEVEFVVDTRPNGSDEYVRIASHSAAAKRQAHIIAVNLKYFWYVAERPNRFIAPENYRLIAEATHPELFPAHTYEGRRPWERRRLAERKYAMRVYIQVPLDL